MDEESKKQANILKDETTTTESTMAIMKDKEEQNTLKRHRSEDTVRSQHRCKKCGTLHKWAECIAFGKKCLKCGKLGHFAKCCRTPRKVEAITDKEDHSQFSLRKQRQILMRMDDVCTGHTNQIQGGHRFTSKHHSSLQMSNSQMEAIKHQTD